MTKRDLQKAAIQATETTLYDRVIQVGLDVIQLVPVAGTIVATVGHQIVPQDHAIYLRDTLLEVAQRIEALESARVDHDYMASDGFRGDIEEVVEALGSKRNRDKRDHYVAALTNLATVDRPDEVERQRFLDILADLRMSHLRLLAVIATAGDHPSHGTLDEYLTTRLPDQDLENIKLDWLDMQNAGILAQMPTGLAMTPLSERMHHSLPAIGRRFAAFVEATTA